MTDWFRFEQLYLTRKKILLPIIKNQGLYDTNELDNTFKIFDILISDDTAFKEGNSLVEMLSKMCNGNIRRIAASVSEVAMNIFKMLNDPSSNCISFLQFKEFWGANNNKFLMRRTAIQCLLRIIVALPDFDDMKLGSSWNTVIDEKNVGTLVRRILVLLSRRSRAEDDKSFAKLHELVSASYANERNSRPILRCDRHFKPLADVLCALNRPSYRKPLTAPWIIIRYNEDVIADSSSFADALEAAWGDYLNNGHSYPIAKYGARITKSGEYFVSTIHCDFSFFAALYCNEEKPIMLLKNIDAVTSQIDKVWDKAKEYIKTLNEIDDNYFGKDKNGLVRMRSLAGVELEHLFRITRKGEQKEVSLQELIVYRIHMFLLHYELFLKDYGAGVFDNSNSELMYHVRQKIEEIEQMFEELRKEEWIVSTTELFKF
jgi:hypothetical protein